MRWSLCAVLPLICPAIALAAPTITNISPADRAFTNSKTVSATVTGSGALTVSVTVNGDAATPATQDDPNDLSHFTATNAGFVNVTDPNLVPFEGNSVVRVTATDDNGTQFEEVTVTFDDLKPAVSAVLTHPGPLPNPSDPNIVSPFASVRIAGAMSDNDPNFVGQLFVRGFGVSGFQLDPNDAYSKRIALSPGANSIVVRGRDRAGNITDQTFDITRTIVCQDPNFPISGTTFATYSVDRDDDLPDADLSDDVCDVRKDVRPDPDPNNPPFTPPRQKCTLRAAIQTANHHPGDDRILLSNSGVIGRQRQGAGEDAAATGDLDVTENLRIVGSNRDATIIDGSKLGDRVFDVRNGAHLQLLHLTVENGRSPKPADPNEAEGGGCLRVQGDLRANSVAFLGCKSFGSGGAVLLEDANTTANMTCTIVARSQSSKDGGAIAIDEGQLTLRDSTLALNSAVRRGGGISALGSADPNDLVLTNVTLSQNKAKLAGGALDLGASASARLNNCTIANNSAKAGSTLSTTDDGQATVSNSILGDAKRACDPNSPEPVISLGGNIDRDGTCLLSPTTGDQTPMTTGLKAVDPKLDRLATNKASNGPPTLGLKLGSPAIDQAGGAVACEPLDARDTERGDWPRVNVGVAPFCDVGALELFVTPPD